MYKLIMADEIMLVNGKLDWVSSYNGEDGVIRIQSLPVTVRGTVKDQYGNKVNTGTVRSTGLCISSVFSGQYTCMDIPGSWTLTYSGAGYMRKSVSLYIKPTDTSVRKDLRVNCYDDDNDGICDIYDNRPSIPNGPLAALCKQKECSVFFKSCSKDYCGCDCLNNQEIDPCW